MGKLSEHHYQMTVKWTGSNGQGTKDYRSYDRSHIISCQGKPDLLATADPTFRGDPTKYNPEEFLLAALSSCHMLSYLHLCAVNDIIVLEYIDQPTATMVVEPSGAGHFKEAILHPTIVIANEKLEKARELHHLAHEKCFIANSVNFPVTIEPSIRFKSAV